MCPLRSVISFQKKLAPAGERELSLGNMIRQAAAGFPRIPVEYGTGPVLQRHLTPCAVGLPTHRAGGARRRPQYACPRRVRRPGALRGAGVPRKRWERYERKKAARQNPGFPPALGSSGNRSLPRHPRGNWLTSYTPSSPCHATKNVPVHVIGCDRGFWQGLSGPFQGPLPAEGGCRPGLTGRVPGPSRSFFLLLPARPAVGGPGGEKKKSAFGARTGAKSPGLHPPSAGKGG